MLYNLEALQAAYSEDNEVTIYTDGNEKFDALIDAIDHAEHFIHIQYYIIKQDILFERIVKHLIKKAKRAWRSECFVMGWEEGLSKDSYWKIWKNKGL